MAKYQDKVCFWKIKAQESLDDRLKSEQFFKKPDLNKCKDCPGYLSNSVCKGHYYRTTVYNNLNDWYNKEEQKILKREKEKLKKKTK